MAANDLDSSDDNLWERVLKIVADKDVGAQGHNRRARRAKTCGRL